MMDPTAFREVIEQDLAPMLQAQIQAGTVTSTPREKTTSYDGPVKIAVKPERSTLWRLLLSRSQAFSSEEHGLAEQFINELGRILALGPGDHREELLKGLPRRVVAAHLGAGPLLRSSLERLEEWSSQTYEGQRIVAGTCQAR
jgi:hypothetical protein